MNRDDMKPVGPYVYQNKHNGREITIIEQHIGDTGVVLYKAQDTSDESTTWLAHYDFDDHWVINPHFKLASEIQERIDDACEAHSQTINTSDGEE